MKFTMRKFILFGLLLTSFGCLASKEKNYFNPDSDSKAGATEYIILLCTVPGNQKVIIRATSDGIGISCIKATHNGTEHYAH